MIVGPSTSVYKANLTRLFDPTSLSGDGMLFFMAYGQPIAAYTRGSSLTNPTSTLLTVAVNTQVPLGPFTTPATVSVSPNTTGFIPTAADTSPLWR